ncbi:MAG: PD-(D/E)XK nuclease family protein, partial [Candidatus Hinthialibacter sp.]
MNIYIETPLRVSGVSERDIDLLLLEEFFSSPKFIDWFVESIDFQEAKNSELIQVRRSATDLTGESDLEVELSNHAGDRFILLIENKIKAHFQPRQAHRYQERGASYVSRGLCKKYKTVLIAPHNYLGDDSGKIGFDAVIEYEAVI